ncbi:MAG: DMT family transporter [Alphaproteobacteria bacterium]
MQFKMPTLAKADAMAPAKLGALLMVTAAFAFSIMTAMIRQAGQDLPPIEIAFLRNIFGALFMAPFFIKHGLRIFHTNRPTMHGARALFGFVGMVSWFSAITLIPLAQAVALNFTGPLFATVIAALILHEVVRARRWSATILGFIGALIVLRPGFVPFPLAPAWPCSRPSPLPSTWSYSAPWAAPNVRQP